MVSVQSRGKSKGKSPVVEKFHVFKDLIEGPDYGVVNMREHAWHEFIFECLIYARYHASSYVITTRNPRS